jgi:hypothetical protein
LSGWEETRFMNWAATSRHAFRLAIGLIVAALGYALVHQTSVDRFIAADTEGLNTLITLIGSIYAVMFAFVIFVIWGQFTEVENAALRECSLLNELLRVNQYLNPDANRATRRSVGEYAQRVANSEWPSLGQGRKDPSTEKAFAVLMNLVIRTAPASADEEALVTRLIDITRKLSQQRDERIAKSLTRIPPTLLALVRIMAGTLLLLVFWYPFHSWLVGLFGFVLLAVILFLSNVVMTDTDNPFDGIFNVSPRPFSELML